MNDFCLGYSLEYFSEKDFQYQLFMTSTCKNTIVKNTFESNLFLKEAAVENQFLSDISSSHRCLHFTVYLQPHSSTIDCVSHRDLHIDCPFDLSFFFLPLLFFSSSDTNQHLVSFILFPTTMKDSFKALCLNSYCCHVLSPPRPFPRLIKYVIILKHLLLISLCRLLSVPLRISTNELLLQSLESEEETMCRVKKPASFSVSNPQSKHPPVKYL